MLISNRRSFFILIRLVFTLFSLYFINDIFYYWDGYSYYMEFIDFIPEMSMAFILWTSLGILVTILLWILFFLLLSIAPKSSELSFELFVSFLLFVLAIIVVKRTLLSGISLHALFGGNRYLIIAVFVFSLVVLFIAFQHRISKTAKKVVIIIDKRITPLVWIFLLFFIISAPLSMKNTSNAEKSAASDSVQPYPASSIDRPNFLLVVLDTLTAEDMGLYDYDRNTTPFISDWARDAVVFKNVNSPSNWTSSSVMSLMTGQRLWTHGFWNISKKRAVTNYDDNFPRILSEKGYGVYAFVQNRHAHPSTLGIRNAFKIADNYYSFQEPSPWWFDSFADRFLDRIIVKEWIFELNPLAEIILLFRPDNNKTRVPPENVYGSFLDFMQQRNANKANKEPYFAWLHVYPPHYPYLPPESFMGKFGDIGILSSENSQLNSGLIESDYDSESQGDVDILRKRYDEFILYSDNQFKNFIERLENEFDLSNTIVILLSDHGESFSHGYQGHSGKHLYQQLIHVPLVVKFPESMRDSTGNTGFKELALPIELIDIAPTIIQYAGLDIPEWIEGRSLKPLIDGRKLEPVPVYSMQFINNSSLGEKITKGTIAIREGDFKLIYYLDDDSSLLFNLKSDPHESINLVDDKTDVAGRLKRLIKEQLSIVNEKILRSD